MVRYVAKNSEAEALTQEKSTWSSAVKFKCLQSPELQRRGAAVTENVRVIPVRSETKILDGPTIRSRCGEPIQDIVLDESVGALQ
jgi:hypothetical protein